MRTRVLAAAAAVLLAAGCAETGGTGPAAPKDVPALRNDALRFVDQAGGIGAVVPVVLVRRLDTLLTTLLLLAGLGLVGWAEC